jgi:hypothetical protein
MVVLPPISTEDLDKKDVMSLMEHSYQTMETFLKSNIKGYHKKG